ncbi:hypothetical protein DY000_02050651 [Brassica cretica]|uniref:Uncharacterized protein n=1 Tax=Brassica cretica TaxID=69181 RepID=A0ABQ7EXP4_BRACR|nr:hypothetical protein DY000_02050651 [Brassica cretica]
MRSHIMNFGNNILVMCDAYMPAGNPIPTNKRHNAAKIFSSSKVASEEPWYGIEQEYTLMQKGVNWKLIIVMCDAYMPAGNPIPTNKRHNAAKIFSSSKVASEEPWYGIEQEYTLMQKGVNWKLIIGSSIR